MNVILVNGIVINKFVIKEIVDTLLCQEALQSRIVGIECRALSVP